MVNEWTRDDLPDATELCRMSVYNIDVMVDRNLNAIVDHLNTHHSKPVAQMPKSVHVPEGPRTTAMALMTAGSALDRIERIERERDAAVARADESEQKAQRYSDKFNRVRSFNVEMKARAERAERQRDEATERADQLRDERDDAVQSCITVGRARDHWRARAEAAEARLAAHVLGQETDHA